ncbi:Uncharacterized protein APZ42_024002 [Daphnia magna]|uniref:Uncharacterized protein n=1 Tax=Daphnia magna TaxID=35525 RepID=A0A0P6BWZ2_9CRUS|nr:Uncharacterized protein APZ42_024002 [Daphnia magna]
MRKSWRRRVDREHGRASMETRMMVLRGKHWGYLRPFEVKQPEFVVSPSSFFSKQSRFSAEGGKALLVA